MPSLTLTGTTFFKIDSNFNGQILFLHRFTAEAFMEVIQENTGKAADPIDLSRIGKEPLVTQVDSADLKGVLIKLCNLHMLARIEADLPYFIQSGLLTVEEAEEVNGQ